MKNKKDIAHDWLKRYTGTDPKKYGDWILYKPKFNLENFLLWFFPYIVLIAGGFIIVFLIKKRSKKV